MADWTKITGVGDVEDRRGLSTGVLAGGGGIVTVIIVFALNYFGIAVDPALVQTAVTQFDQATATARKQSQPPEFSGDDSYQVFTAKVLASTTDTWTPIFASANQSYTAPKIVLFRTATASACGGATSQMGPHYCPADQMIYIDEIFYDALKTKFQANPTETAQAYVVAHEVGHHVQHQLGAFDARANTTNAASVQVELQADCYAGIWGYSVSKLGVVAPAEMRQAMDMAAVVGDDHIQRNTTGRVSPETWTHGSSAQRIEAFTRGYNTGNPGVCKNF